MRTTLFLPITLLFTLVACQKANLSEKSIERTDSSLELSSSGSASVTPDPARASTLWTAVYNSEDGFDTAQYFDFIIEASECGWSEDYAWWTIDKFSSVQIQSGEQTGCVPRTLKEGAQDYSDANNIEFAMQLACIALIRYYPTWSADTRAAFDDFADKAVYALWQHDKIAVTYSNIYLMHIWNLVALGENLSSSRTWGVGLKLKPSAIAAKGYELLDNFIARTAAYGIHEHNSPTYTGVQAECIGYLANFTKNAAAKAKAEKLRDYLSLFIAANFYTPSRTASGGMSRCYYRGASGGKLGNLALWMLAGERPTAAEQLACWSMGPRALKINGTYPRMVSYLFGDVQNTFNDGRKYYAMNGMTYVDKYYSVGSVGHHYTGNGTEKSVNIVVSTEEHPYNINFIHLMEGRNDPYGFSYYLGHAWVCIRDAFARAQHDNQIVFVEAGNGRDNPQATNFTSHILLPKTNVSEIWVDDTKVTDWSSAPTGNCFFIKIDHVVVSIRFLYTFDKSGNTATHTLIDDSATSTRNYYVLTDGTHRALRISTTLSSSSMAGAELAGVAMWWRADDCIRTATQFARLRSKVMNATVSVPAQKSFSEGDAFSCYVNTPEGVKLGVSGSFERKKYYNRYISTDTSPEYFAEKSWYFAQKEAWGNSTDFSKFCSSFLSVNGWDEAKRIFE